jgi:serine O-acetyltransferase
MATRAFAQDLKRWRHRQFQPQDGQPLTMSLSLKEALVLLYLHPALWATAFYRMARWCHVHRVRVLPSLLTRMNLFLFGVEIGPMVPIGPGFYLAHPVGVVIIARRIGANATFVGSNTVGMRNEWEFPEIGDAVFIGVGARILGAVKIGDGSKIGANAVVVDDVPAGTTAVGIPARVVQTQKVRPQEHEQVG